MKITKEILENLVYKEYKKQLHEAYAQTNTSSLSDQEEISIRMALQTIEDAAKEKAEDPDEIAWHVSQAADALDISELENVKND